MSRSLFAIVILLCAGLLTAADNNKIPAGYDTWETVGSGLTFMSFASEPIPAGFFCDGCEAFKGRIDFDGVPIATNPPGLFVRTDTIIERLDDAYFADGSAFSRLRVKALHLQSEELLFNEAGAWDVRVGLAEEQPITTIDFNKRNDSSGTFYADLVLTVRMTFTNADDSDDVRVLERTVHFTEFNQFPYTIVDLPTDEGPTRFGKRSRADVYSFEVDTDADGQPDSPMTFTFESLQFLSQSVEFTGYYTIDELASHQDPEHEHATRSTSIGNDKDKLDNLTAGVDRTGLEIGPLDDRGGELDPAILQRTLEQRERDGN